MEKDLQQDLNYTKCGTELVYQGTAVSFYKEHIKLPDGRMVEWDLIQHPGGAAVLPIDDEENVLLVEQYRNALERITLEIPAGKREAGEAYEVCAARELEEETGYYSEHIVPLGKSAPAVGYSNEVLGLFYADHLKKSCQNLDEDEWIHVKKYSLTEAVNMVMQGKIIDSKTVSAILMYAQCKQEK